MHRRSFLVLFALLTLGSGCSQGSKNPTSCPKETDLGFYPLPVTRVPLEVFVQSGYPANVSEETSTGCDVDPSTLDGGVGSDGGTGTCFTLAATYSAARTEGCGLVTYEVPRPGWPRTRVYALDGGALVGAARADDVLTPLAGTDCVDAAYVAGTFPVPACNAVTVRCCRTP